MMSRILKSYLLLVLGVCLAGQAIAAERIARACGTSAAPASTQGVGQDSGIGGTGHPESLAKTGIGGTGNTPDSDVGHPENLAKTGIGGTGNTPDSSVGNTGIHTAGLVESARGILFVVDKANQKFMLTKDDAICAGDHIATGSASSAKIQFLDGSLLYLRANTDARIDAFAYQEGTQQAWKSAISLIHGNIRSVTGAIGKANPKQYLLQTPNARINVLGTDFQVSYHPAVSVENKARAYVAVTAGQVRVENDQGHVVLGAGQAGVVIGLNAPEHTPYVIECETQEDPLHPNSHSK